MMSASTCPGPDRGQLVDIADDQQRRVVRNRFHERLHQQDVDHRGLVDDEQIAIEGISALRLKPPLLGSTSKSRWIVLASTPVASVMRLAARPVARRAPAGRVDRRKQRLKSRPVERLLAPIQKPTPLPINAPAHPRTKVGTGHRETSANHPLGLTS
jgi:hypothetical protein